MLQSTSERSSGSGSSTGSNAGGVISSPSAPRRQSVKEKQKVSAQDQVKSNMSHIFYGCPAIKNIMINVY